MQEGRAGIEGELSDLQFGIATADTTLFFHDGDIKTASRENHACR